MKKLIHEIHRRSLWQVLGLYLAGSWVALQVVGQLAQSVGFPEWVEPFALVLLIIGLPVVLATAVVQEGRPSTGGGEATAAAAEPTVTDSGTTTPPVAPASVGAPPPDGAHHRLFNWRNAILGGVLAFSLLFGFAGLAVLVKEKVLSPEEALAENAAPAIAVLPFAVRGEGLEVWREGMVDLLSTNLDGAAGMRAIAGRTVIARWNEEGAGESSGDLETSLAVARATGASYALLGTAISSGSGMRLTADLYDAKTGKTLGSVQVEGPADSVFALVDELSVAAVREMATGETAGVETLTLTGVSTRSVDALKAYLEGMSQFRRSDFAAAAESFKVAVAEDSTFALAYLRLGDAYGWMEGAWSSLQAEAHEKAEAYRDELPYREQVLMDAELSVTERNLDGLEPLRRYVRDHPDDAAAWFMLGEVYIHRGHEIPVSRDEIERALQRAVTLDPTFGPYYGHLIDLALWTTPDSAYVRGVIDDYREVTGGAHDRQLAFDLAFGAGRSPASTAFRWTRSSICSWRCSTPATGSRSKRPCGPTTNERRTRMFRASARTGSSGLRASTRRRGVSRRARPSRRWSTPAIPLSLVEGSRRALSGAFRRPACSSRMRISSATCP